MNPRLTIALAVVLAILAGVYFFGGLPEPGPPGPGVTGTPTPLPPEIINYSTSEITRVRVTAAADTINLDKHTSGDWSYSRMTVGGPVLANAPADSTRINGLVMRLGNLKARGKIADTVQAPAEFGLTQPEAEVTVVGASDSITLVIGAQNPQRNGYYAQISGAPSLYLVESLLVDDLKRLVSQPPDPPTPTPVPTITPTAAGTSTPGPTGTPTP